MTPDQYRAELASLGLSIRGARKVLNVSARTSTRYAKFGVPEKTVPYVREKLASYADGQWAGQFALSKKGEN